MGLFFLVFFGILGFILYTIIQKISEWSRNNASPVEENAAIVVAKRTMLSGGENATTSYYVTFEFENNERRELSVRGNVYGSIAEGDVGTLRSQGTRFLGFTRTNDPYKIADPDSEMHKCAACGATFRGTYCEYCGTPAEGSGASRWH
ncbi:MAG: DUF2500 domain-containing protein [Clostridia bacterium]|nr:DUF2500 domain-containing protein [Clostridia bacterium]